MAAHSLWVGCQCTAIDEKVHFKMQHTTPHCALYALWCAAVGHALDLPGLNGIAMLLKQRGAFEWIVAQCVLVHSMLPQCYHNAQVWMGLWGRMWELTGSPLTEVPDCISNCGHYVAESIAYYDVYGWHKDGTLNNGCECTFVFNIFSPCIWEERFRANPDIIKYGYAQDRSPGIQIVARTDFPRWGRGTPYSRKYLPLHRAWRNNTQKWKAKFTNYYPKKESKSLTNSNWNSFWIKFK